MLSHQTEFQRSTYGVASKFVNVSHFVADDLQVIKQKADAGDATAQNAYAVKVKKTNPAEARKYYLMAVDQDFLIAFSNLAILSAMQKDTPETQRDAAKYFKLAADKGHAPSQYNYGRLLTFSKYGDLVKDTQEAFKYFKMAADQGFVLAHFAVATRYLTGEGVKPDVGAAVTQFQVVVDNSSATDEDEDIQQCWRRSMLQLGVCYATGHGVSKDPVEAFRRFKLSCDGDATTASSSAQYNLGICYLTGFGVAKNECAAFSMFELAAKIYFKDAKFNVAVCYGAGVGVAKDTSKAVELYKEIYFHPESLYNLAKCYETGEGVAADATKAAQLFKEATDNGFTDSMLTPTTHLTQFAKAALSHVAEPAKPAAALICHSCKKPVTTGTFNSVSGKFVFHVGCFNCAKCGDPRDGKSFVEKDGLFYCPDGEHKSTPLPVAATAAVAAVPETSPAKKLTATWPPVKTGATTTTTTAAATAAPVVAAVPLVAAAAADSPITAALQTLLQSLSLTAYVEPLVAFGVETIADVASLTQQDLQEEVKMKVLHARKLMKAVQPSADASVAPASVVKEKSDSLADLLKARRKTDKFDVFLTHDWGDDVQGRNNHNRVSVINDALKKRGFVTWFDSDRMQGHIVQQMCKGIDDSTLVVVFITKRYISKCLNVDDNCCKEFHYAAKRKGVARLLPVVMEADTRNQLAWSGPVMMELGNVLYTDLSDDGMANLDTFVATIVSTLQATD